LAAQMLRDPVRVAVTPVASTVERISQRVIMTDKPAKSALLIELLRGEVNGQSLVFTRTKHGADKVVRSLHHAGLSAEAIHGNKSQNQRERVLGGFRAGKLKTLVATDIAARGIDVEGISHVINYDLPNIPESYVHRIGRTARAGADGIAISLCSHDELPFLRDIEKLIRMAIPATDRRSGRPVRPPSTTHAKHAGSGHAKENGPGRGPKRSRRHRRAMRDQHAQLGPAAADPGNIGSVAFMQRRDHKSPRRARPAAR
jgi:ATP-dependent RNA helicase RhlE